MSASRFSVLAVATLTALVVTFAQTRADARSPAAARSNIPPFCVLTGGPRGPGSVPQICQFFDYQQCLQAAARLRGNCVVNVDYPGKITNVPGATWSQPVR